MQQLTDTEIYLPLSFLLLLKKSKNNMKLLYKEINNAFNNALYWTSLLFILRNYFSLYTTYFDDTTSVVDSYWVLPFNSSCFHNSCGIEQLFRAPEFSQSFSQPLLKLAFLTPGILEFPHISTVEKQRWLKEFYFILDELMKFMMFVEKMVLALKWTPWFHIVYFLIRLSVL